MKQIKWLVTIGIFCLVVVPFTVNADDDGPEWVGTVTQWPGAVTSGTWVIGGITFQATSTTIFEQEHGALTINTCAQVKYYSTGSSNIATEISSEEAYKCGQSGGGDDDGSGEGGGDSQYGILQSFTTPGSAGPWVIGGVTYNATTSTRFEMDDGPFTVGGCVEFSFIPGSNQLIEIGTEPVYKCTGNGGTSPNTPYNHTYGVLNAFPTNTLIGNWVINGTTYVADATTYFEQKYGPFFIGVCVEVKYTGTNSAVEISVEDPYKCTLSGSPIEYVEAKFYGIITAVPAGYAGQSQYTGQWQIGGRTISSDVSTQLKAEHGPLAVNTCAEVELNSTGLATEIKAERAYKCGTSTYTNIQYGYAREIPDGKYGTWVINDTDNITKTYYAGIDAEFLNSSYSPGNCVRVEYYIQDGVHHIATIEHEDDSKCNNTGTPLNVIPSKVYAIVDHYNTTSSIWMIGGIQYQQLTTTTVEGSPQLNDCVKAKYTPTGSQPYPLIKLEKEDTYKCQVSQSNSTWEYKQYGHIEALPIGFVPTNTTTWQGNWQIAGITYKTTGSTEFKQEYGFFAIGSYVEVKYITGSNVYTATSIETHVAPGAGRKWIEGILDDRPDSNGNGYEDDWDGWVVNGVTYPSDPNIEIGDLTGSTLSTSQIGINAAPVIGQPVLLQTYRGADGQNHVVAAAQATNVYLPAIFRY